MSMTTLPASPGKSKSKRQALGNGLYVRADGAYEHGFTCRYPHDQCTGRKWHIVTLRATTKRAARDEIASRVDGLVRREITAPGTSTVKEIGEAWVESLNLRPRSVESYRYHLTQNIYPRLGHVKAQDVTPQAVADFVGWLQNHRKVGGWTQAGALRTLSGLFAHAVWTGVVAQNPVASVPKSKRPKRAQEPHRYLSGDEIKRLLDSASETFRPVFYTAVWTGLRESELLGLVWSDIDLQAGTIKVSAQLSRGTQDAPATRVPPKTGPRVVDIDPELIAFLREHRMASPYKLPTHYVFTTQDGTPHHYRNMTRAFDKAAERAGLNGSGRKLRFHDLRRTYASILLRAVEGEACDLAYVAGQLGHSVEVLCSTYAGLIDGGSNRKRGQAAIAAARMAAGGAS